MYTIIYSLDFEPITVLDIPKDFLDIIEKKGTGILKIKDTDKVCRLYCGMLSWPDGSKKPVIVTKDEEEALYMQCSWLPGQRSSVGFLKNHVRGLTDKLIKAMRK
jgi:hypothetical protein